MGKYSYKTQNNLPFPFIYVTETFSVSQKLNLGPPGSVDKIKGHKRKIWGQRFEKRIDNHSGCPDSPSEYGPLRWTDCCGITVIFRLSAGVTLAVAGHGSRWSRAGPVSTIATPCCRHTPHSRAFAGDQGKIGNNIQLQVYKLHRIRKCSALILNI